MFRLLKDFKRKTTFLILYRHCSLRGKQQGLGFCKQEGIKRIKTAEVPLEGLVMTASNGFSTFWKGQLEFLLWVSLALFSRNACEWGGQAWSRRNVSETSEATLSFGCTAPCKIWQFYIFPLGMSDNTPKVLLLCCTILVHILNRRGRKSRGSAVLWAQLFILGFPSSQQRTELFIPQAFLTGPFSRINHPN